MAKIKLKLGENEIEIDSRDYYVDNNTLSEVVVNLAKLIEQNQSQPSFETPTISTTTTPTTPMIPEQEANYESLNSLEDVELFEPEFSEPKPIDVSEIKDKLKILEKNEFFTEPRTTTETVQQLREYGWVASPLDVSKTLVNMASNKEISKNSSENRTYYFIAKYQS